MKKKLIINSVVIIALLVNFTFTANAFSDVKGDEWYSPYIGVLISKGIIDGSKPTFDPLMHVTRDVAAKVIVKAMGYADADLIVPLNPSFTDVSKSSWAYPYVETARSLKLVSGYGNDLYLPNKEVSRAEFAIMIMRAFQLTKNSKELVSFVDVKPTDWFYDAVGSAQSWSIINGYPGGLFLPNSPINRAEMSKMISLAMKVPKNTQPVSNQPTSGKDVVIAKPVETGTTNTYNGPSTTGATSETGSTPSTNTTSGTGGTSDTANLNLFSEDFSTYSLQNYTDGNSFGSWLVQFAGFGNVGIEDDGGNKVLSLSPQAADSAGVTHAALVTGPSYSGSIQLEAKMMTVQQLRTGSTPNPWEIFWMVWNYSDNDHFYYFIPKTNGWELGKRDPNYPGGQRFLATGSDKTFPVGKWYDVKIQQDTGNKIAVWVDGVQITSFTDSETPYTSGKVAFYTEDAHVHVDDVIVNH